MVVIQKRKEVRKGEYCFGGKEAQLADQGNLKIRPRIRNPHAEIYLEKIIMEIGAMFDGFRQKNSKINESLMGWGSKSTIRPQN